ncbi:hypothetical protein QG37_01835 [Candidozyma auris]|nr:hypothetical protein QG37_01835 [[Candida] auris]
MNGTMAQIAQRMADEMLRYLWQFRLLFKPEKILFLSFFGK